MEQPFVPQVQVSTVEVDYQEIVLTQFHKQNHHTDLQIDLVMCLEMNEAHTVVAGNQS